MGESRRFWAAFSALCLACVLAAFMMVYRTVDASPMLPGPNIKMIDAKGHGSAVHIGNGFILTAAHVVGDLSAMEIKFEDGSTSTAETLWVNKATDIALMRFKDEGQIQSAKLACRNPAIGEPVTAFGNPSVFENLTFHGFINGSRREMGPWESIVPSDLTVIPGMSGGALYDAKGEVIGINVGTGMIPMGFMASWARIGLSVPGKTICGLMGRV